MRKDKADYLSFLKDYTLSTNDKAANLVHNRLFVTNSLGVKKAYPFEKHLLVNENRSNSSLDPFDKEFYNSIDKGDQLLPDHPKGIYYTLIYQNKKVGICGVIPLKKYYFQVAIHQNFRRKGLVKVAADLIAYKHNIKLLVSSIDKKNKASIGAHLKAGFRELTHDEKQDWKKDKLSSRTGTITLVKEY